MATDAAVERLKHELHCALDRMRHDIDRVEILAAALSAFDQPVPDYEPAFRHLRKITLGVYELGEQNAD